MAWLFNQAKWIILDDVCKVKKQVEISISKTYELAGPAADPGDLTGVGGARWAHSSKENKRETEISPRREPKASRSLT